MKRIILALLLTLMVAFAWLPQAPVEAHGGQMESLIVGGFNDALTVAGTTEVNALSGGYTWSGTAIYRQQLIATEGLLKDFYVKLDTAPQNGAGVQSYTFTVVVNDAPTALAVVVSEDETSGKNSVNEIEVNPGDTVHITCADSGTPTASSATWGAVFEATNTKESAWMSCGVASKTATTYTPFGHSGAAGSATEDTMTRIVAADGTLSDLYCKLSADPGTNPDAYRITVRVNGATPGGSLTTTITADATTGSDLVNTVDVAAGDRVCVMIEPLETPSVEPMLAFAVTFTADNDLESVIMGGSSDTPTLATTEYHGLSSGLYSATWEGTESTRVQLSQAGFIFEDFYAYMVAGTSTGDYTLKVRAGGADTGIALTITAGGRTGSDIANTYNTVEGEYVDISCAAAGTARAVQWGILCRQGSLPTVETDAATSVGETSATLNGEVTNTGGAVIITRGFEWDTDSGAPYANDVHEDGAFGVGVFSEGLSGLTVNTPYYFRAYATSAAGTSYGVEETFTTLLPYPLPPTALAGVIVSDNINLTWTKGLWAENTTVVRHITHFPMTTADGIVVYSGPLALFSDNVALYDVDEDGIYYSFWSVNARGTSATYSTLKIGGTAMATALGSMTNVFVFMVLTGLGIALLGLAWWTRLGAFALIAAVLWFVFGCYGVSTGLMGDASLNVILGLISVLVAFGAAFMPMLWRKPTLPEEESDYTSIGEERDTGGEPDEPIQDGYGKPWKVSTRVPARQIRADRRRNAEHRARRRLIDEP